MRTARSTRRDPHGEIRGWRRIPARLAHDGGRSFPNRYGNLREGAKDIKEHPFYKNKNFDWNNYEQRGEAFNPPKFDASKYEWVAAGGVVTEAKKCKAEDQALFKDF